MVVTTIGYVGVALGALGWLCRKMFARSFGSHDESDEETVTGKVVLVTGANAGLGKETAYELARRGAKVVMASRNEDLTKTVIEQIKSKVGNGCGELIPMKLDLGCLESIRGFANEFRSKFDKIDILVNNAGVFVPIKKQMKTADGFEFNFGVNHLGHFYLTNLLLDLVKQAAPSRIVIVSSRLSDKGKLDFDDLMLERENPETSKVSPYSYSKYANLLFAKELSKRLEGSNVNVYALCPGWVKTDLARYMDLSWMQYAMMIPVAFVFMRTPHQGVQTILHCALSRKLRTETGQFYRNCAPWTPKSEVTDELATKLWNVSESLVNKIK